MPRTKKTPFRAWQTCKENGIEERYIRLGNSQLLHEATKDLSDKSFRIYVYMLLESGGKMKFEFPYSKWKKISSKDAFQNAKKELIEKGFITLEQNNANLRKPNIFAFSEKWKEHRPP